MHFFDDDTVRLYLHDPEKFPVELLAKRGCPKCKGTGVMAKDEKSEELKIILCDAEDCATTNLIRLIMEAKLYDKRHFRRIIPVHNDIIKPKIKGI